VHGSPLIFTPPKQKGVKAPTYPGDLSDSDYFPMCQFVVRRPSPREFLWRRRESGLRISNVVGCIFEVLDYWWRPPRSRLPGPCCLSTLVRFQPAPLEFSCPGISAALGWTGVWRTAPCFREELGKPRTGFSKRTLYEESWLGKDVPIPPLFWVIKKTSFRTRCLAPIGPPRVPSLGSMPAMTPPNKDSPT